MKLAIFGAGAWGTSLSIAFSRRHDVSLWTWQEDHCRAMRRDGENRQFFAGHKLPSAVRIEHELPAALAAAELALIVTPLAGLRETLRGVVGQQGSVPVLWACKGLEASTGLLPHQVVAEEAAGLRCGALTGPTFAEEVARGLPTAMVVASTDAAFARALAQELNDARLRIYANDDVVGAEVGGAVKNVLAIAAGVCDGLGMGLNARAALLTRGLAEITRFGIALGGRRETFMGLTGMGDLILTCTGDLSRNRRVGLALAGGKPLAEITRDLGHVAEGVPSAREIARRAQAMGVEMPITAAVCALLDGRIKAADAVALLMNRDPKDEAA